MIYKTIFILTIVCLLGIFSSARKPGKKCNPSCRLIKPVEPTKPAGFDLFPGKLFIFDI